MKEGINGLFAEELVDIQFMINREMWDSLSRTSGLPEEIIEKYSDKVVWRLIFIYQNLSEPFIERHITRTELDRESCWSFISSFQVLSEAFIEKYADKLDWVRLLDTGRVNRKKYPPQRIKQLKEKVALKKLLDAETYNEVGEFLNTI